MFSRSQADGAETLSMDKRVAPENTVPSLIGEDLSVIGDIESAGAIQIDGAVEGDIHCPVLTIGPKASVRGAIVAEIARIAGSVQGRIRAGQVELAKSAEVLGDIVHESLSIEAGAFVDGSFKRLQGAPLLTEQKRSSAHLAVAGE